MVVKNQIHSTQLLLSLGGFLTTHHRLNSISTTMIAMHVFEGEFLLLRLSFAVSYIHSERLSQWFSFILIERT